jgi:hypothetical protein
MVSLPQPVGLTTSRLFLRWIPIVAQAQAHIFLGVRIAFSLEGFAFGSIWGFALQWFAFFLQTGKSALGLA